MIFKAGFFSIFILSSSSSFAMLQELESKAIAAISSGSHSAIMAALAAHKSGIEAEAGSLISSVLPQAGAIAGDVEAGAGVVAAVAGMVPNGGAVAGLASNVEAIAASVQQQSGGVNAAIASTAGGSSSQAAKESAIVKAAQSAEQTAKSGTGLSSRALAGLVAAGSLGGVALLAYTDWFGTNSSSSENETQQRQAAYIGAIPAFSALLGVAGTSGYYAITNKWYNDTVTQAAVTTQVATNHANTVAPLLAQVKQKSN